MAKIRKSIIYVWLIVSIAVVFSQNIKRLQEKLIFKMYKIFSFSHGYSKIEKILITAYIIHISLYFVISIYLIILANDFIYILLYIFLFCASIITIMITVSTKT